MTNVADSAYEEFQDFTDVDLGTEAHAAGETEQAEKIRENRLRRMAVRQGLRFIKSRRRDPRALDYGRYWVANQNNLLMTPEQGMDLDEIDAWLSEPDER